MGIIVQVSVNQPRDVFEDSIFEAKAKPRGPSQDQVLLLTDAKAGYNVGYRKRI